MAFFECTDLPLPSRPSHAAYDVFDHIALEVKNSADLSRWRDWLVSQSVEVLCPVDHKGIIESIYFRDPNGYRLELTTPIDPKWNRHTQQAQDDLDKWLQVKEQVQASGGDVSAALKELIGRVKQQRYGTRI